MELNSQNNPTPNELPLSDFTLGPRGTPSEHKSPLSDALQSPIPSLNVSKAMQFGDHHDGIIEAVADMEAGGAVEIGYYYGDLKPKNIIKVSSQVGCPSRCLFCEVGDQRFSRNLQPQELYDQAVFMLQLVAAQGLVADKPFKVSFAGTGEPLLNEFVPEGIERLSALPFSFKVSTVFPRNKASLNRFLTIAEFAGRYAQPVQIQISLVSTSEDYRAQTIGIPVAGFEEIADAASAWRAQNPKRPQINLSLILTNDAPAHPRHVSKLFPPEHFRFRFRQYVPTQHGRMRGLTPITRSRMAAVKNAFREAGYYVADDATPTPAETANGLASGVTWRRELSKRHETP